MRKRLDELDPRTVRGVFKCLLSELQRGKIPSFPRPLHIDFNFLKTPTARLDVICVSLKNYLLRGVGKLKSLKPVVMRLRPALPLWELCSSQRYGQGMTLGTLVHSEIWNNLEKL